MRGFDKDTNGRACELDVQELKADGTWATLDPELVSEEIGLLLLDANGRYVAGRTASGGQQYRLTFSHYAVVATWVTGQSGEVCGYQVSDDEVKSYLFSADGEQWRCLFCGRPLAADELSKYRILLLGGPKDRQIFVAKR